MTDRRYQDIWREQCSAAERIRQRHGLARAMDYLIGEKLDQFAHTAVTRPEWARELPQFVAHVRGLFTRAEVAGYFAALEDEARRQNEGPDAAALEESGLLMTTVQRKDRLARLAALRALLVEEHLGTA